MIKITFDTELMKEIKFVVCGLLLFVISCNSNGLPLKGSFPDYHLVDSNGKEFNFNELKGDVVVISYIYTNCPDICHITSKKIDAFKKSLDKELSDQVTFVSISFDPSRDTPKVLKKHVESMKLDMSNWFFVTGRRDLVYETLKVAGIDPVLDKMESKNSYTLNHRDRISLMDRNGIIRKHYKGSTFDPKELLNDIKTIL